jgi:hypothetical protein
MSYIPSDILGGIGKLTQKDAALAFKAKAEAEASGVLEAKKLSTRVKAFAPGRPKDSLPTFNSAIEIGTTTTGNQANLRVSKTPAPAYTPEKEKASTTPNPKPIIKATTVAKENAFTHLTTMKKVNHLIPNDSQALEELAFVYEATDRANPIFVKKPKNLLEIAMETATSEKTANKTSDAQNQDAEMGADKFVMVSAVKKDVSIFNVYFFPEILTGKLLKYIERDRKI